MTDFNPVEDALERAPWCLLVPIPDFGFTDPDIIGPFATYEEAHNWSLSYPGAIIRKMITPQFDVLCRRQEYEDQAARGPRQ
jgi:hypothetical protein